MAGAQLRENNASFETFEFAVLIFDRYMMERVLEVPDAFDNRAQVYYAMLASIYVSSKLVDTQPVSMVIKLRCAFKHPNIYEHHVSGGFGGRDRANYSLRGVELGFEIELHLASHGHSFLVCEALVVPLARAYTILSYL